MRWSVTVPIFYGILWNYGENHDRVCFIEARLGMRLTAFG